VRIGHGFTPSSQWKRSSPFAEPRADERADKAADERQDREPELVAPRPLVVFELQMRVGLSPCVISQVLAASVSLPVGLVGNDVDCRVAAPIPPLLEAVNGGLIGEPSILALKTNGLPSPGTGLAAIAKTQKSARQAGPPMVWPE
jgi:hypothetical protein